MGTPICTIDEVVDIIVDAAGRVSLPTPEPDRIRDLVASIMTDRGGKVRVISRPRKDSDDEPRCLLAMIAWHRGSTGAWGPESYRSFLDQYERSGWDPIHHNRMRTFDQIDTLAMIWCQVFHGGSRAAAAWQKALHG